jgi:hypothetical protein
MWRTTGLAGIWCGTEAAERRDELVEPKKEVARRGNLTQQAVASLRASGQTREAEQIERDLGVAVADMRCLTP